MSVSTKHDVISDLFFEQIKKISVNSRKSKTVSTLSSAKRLVREVSNC